MECVGFICLWTGMMIGLYIGWRLGRNAERRKVAKMYIEGKIPTGERKISPSAERFNDTKHFN